MERRNKKVKERGNGEGTLYFSETLQCYVAQYVEPSGKRKTIKQKKNEKVGEFKNRFNNIITSINNNTYIATSDTSLYTILNDYIENNYKTGIIGASTYKRNTETLKLLKKCCSSFIDKPIQKVTTAEIKKALPNFIELESISPKTNIKVFKSYSQSIIDKLYMLLGKGFKIAFSERIITFNPMDNESIKKPKSKLEAQKVEALTIDEQKNLINILKKSNHKYKNIILLAIYTGMRIGEILAITNNNINLKENTLVVEKTLTKDKNENVILGNTTKTEAGKRTIFLNNNAVSVLKEVLQNNLLNTYNLIFYDYDRNTFITPTEINCYLKRLNEKYKICPHIHTHMLRHTFATRCIESGMQAKVLQQILGHKNISTTLDTYTSVFEKFNKDENTKYENYMKQIGL